MSERLAKPRFVFTASVVGNILEYYDFTVYAVFITAIGRAFFPTHSDLASILYSLGTFSVGFLTRPLGGILFGYIGDRYGRRIALLISMLGITLPTCVIALLPPYQMIGVIAPILLICMRLIQGLCISGEGTGAAIFVLEHHQRLRPGLTASLVNASNIVGTLLAIWVGILMETYFAQYVEYAWRLAFLLGGLWMGCVGFYLRRRLSETPIFKMLVLQKKNTNHSFKEVFNTTWQAMLVTFCAAAVASSPIYLVKSYIIVHYHNVLHLDHAVALRYMFYANLVTIVSMPLFGSIADRIGIFKTMAITSIILLIGIFPTLYLMVFPQNAMVALTLLGMLAGAAAGPAYIFVLSLFKPQYKFLGVAFSYNLGIALLGSTTPMIGRWLVQRTGLFFAPAFYIMAMVFLFLMVTLIMRKKIAVWIGSSNAVS